MRKIFNKRNRRIVYLHETQIMRSSHSTQEDELSEIARQMGPELLRYAESICRNRSLAEEAVQETFIRFMDHPEILNASHRKPWLFRVCRTRVLDLCRKENRMKPMEPEVMADRADHQPDPAQCAEINDELNRVDRLLAGLPENQREVVRLKYQGDLSYREIAEVTELSVSHVGVLLHTALKSLRGQLQA